MPHSEVVGLLSSLIRQVQGPAITEAKFTRPLSPALLDSKDSGHGAPHRRASTMHAVEDKSGVGDFLDLDRFSL